MCHNKSLYGLNRTYPYPLLSHDSPALFTGHGLRVLGSDAFNLGAVSGFAIPGITGDHAILVQKVQVLALALSSTSLRDFRCVAPNVIIIQRCQNKKKENAIDLFLFLHNMR
jgi:hypothetical protein